MSAADKTHFEATFTALKRILKRYERSLSVKTDKPGDYYLETKSASFRGRPICFGAVCIRKNYVCFYLMPVYANPALLQGMSPALKKRMQGKSCFNFGAPNKQLFSELNRLTEAGFQKYRAEKWL